MPLLGWICEFCYARYFGDVLPPEWDWIYQSAVCPVCRVRVQQDGGYHVVVGGAYAGDEPDPRDPDLAPAVDEATIILSGDD